MYHNRKINQENSNLSNYTNKQKRTETPNFIYLYFPPFLSNQTYRKNFHHKKQNHGLKSKPLRQETKEKYINSKEKKQNIHSLTSQPRKQQHQRQNHQTV